MVGGIGHAHTVTSAVGSAAERQDLIAVLDLQGRVLSVNPGWRAEFRAAASDAAGANFLDGIEPSDRHRVAAEIAACGDGSSPHPISCHLIARDGTLVPVQGTLSRLGRGQAEEAAILVQLYRDLGVAIADAELQRQHDRQEAQQLADAVKDFQTFLWRVEHDADFSVRLPNPHLQACWQITRCAKVECACYGKAPQRCWQVVGTHCGGLVQGEFAQKLEHCEECAVYKAATPGPVQALGESFNNMLYMMNLQHTQLLALHRHNETMASTDMLTGMGNRRAFELAVARMDGMAQRGQLGYALLVIDVDCFRAYNDDSGLMAGDAVLKVLAQCVRGTLRAQDEVFRYDGAEFVAILHGQDDRQGLLVGKRICQAVRDLGVLHRRGVGGRLTASVGVASRLTTDPRELAWQNVLANADAACRCAKAAGRNRAEAATLR